MRTKRAAGFAAATAGGKGMIRSAGRKGNARNESALQGDPA